MKKMKLQSVLFEELKCNICYYVANLENEIRNTLSYAMSFDSVKMIFASIFGSRIFFCNKQYFSFASSMMCIWTVHMYYNWTFFIYDSAFGLEPNQNW